MTFHVISQGSIPTMGYFFIPEILCYLSEGVSSLWPVRWAENVDNGTILNVYQTSEVESTVKALQTAVNA